MIKRTPFILCILLASQISLSAMITEQVPTLKRLASKVYWKNNKQLPPEQKINNEVKILLSTYAPLNGLMITDQFKNARLLEDGLRVQECTEFIKENNLKENRVAIFLRGVKNGIVNPQLHNMDGLRKRFYEHKEERIKKIAESIDSAQEEIVTDVEAEYQSEENTFEIGDTVGVVVCDGLLRRSCLPSAFLLFNTFAAGYLIRYIYFQFN